MTRAEPIRWAVAGTGTIARRFCADMRLSRGGVVAAIASRDPERSRALAEAVRPQIAHGDLQAVLAMSKIDAVYIAGRNETHASQAIACLRAGKPVLVEKPFAASAIEAEARAEASHSAGILAMEAMWMRFTPGIVKLTELVRSGRIGKTVRIEAGLSFASPKADIDPLLDLGVYPAAMALALLGPADVVSAVRAGRGIAMVSRHGDALANLSCGFEAEGDNRLTVVGTNGTITTDAPFFCPSHLWLRASPQPTSTDEPAQAALPAPSRLRMAGALRQGLRAIKRRPIPTPFEGTGLHYQADHFAECLRAGHTESPILPLADSLALMRTIERFDRAAGSIEGPVGEA